MRKLFLLLLVAMVTLGACEILLRLFWHPAFLDERFRRDDLSWISQNVVLNRFGYRDREFSLDKKPGIFRALFLGDSYTYGWMLNDVDSLYPKQVEKLLGEKYREGKFEVINASKPGFSFADSLSRLDQEGVKFSPDIVFVGLNIFDFLSKTTAYRPAPDFLENLRLYQLTLGNVKRLKVAKETDRAIKETYRLDSPEISQAAEKIQATEKTLKQIGTDLVLVVFPYYPPRKPDVGEKYTQYEETLKKLGEKEGIKVILLSKYFDPVADKKTLVLNPTDPHPTALANSLAAEAILKEIDFKKISGKVSGRIHRKTVKISLGTSFLDFKSSLSINGKSWVHFERKYGDSTQKLFLPEGSEGSVSYLENVLKTARLGRHAGWPGAKIEFNLPLNGELTFTLPKRIYGFEIVGVSQFTIYWRDKGALRSLDLDLAGVHVTKDEKEITFKIDSDNGKSLDLAKVTLDVAVKQFDLEENKVVALGKTAISESLSANQKIISSPNYFWCGDTLVSRETSCAEGQKTETPVMVEDSIKPSELPTMTYLY